MKILIKNMLTNKLGNLLALINLFVLASVYSDLFAHWFIHSIFQLVNLPSLLFSSVITEIVFFFPTKSEVTESFLKFYTLIFFIGIYFQWIVIGYLISKFRKN